MFAESMNSWEELGLAPSPLSFAINAKEEEDVTALFSDVSSVAQPPLELDTFEQELRRQEMQQAVNIQEDLLISNSQEQKPHNTGASADDQHEIMAVDPSVLSLNDSGHVEDTQNLIEEMESFLLQHEQAQQLSEVKQEKEEVLATFQVATADDSGLDLLEQVMEEVDMMPAVQEEQKQPQLSAEESQQAEAILDALIKGNLDADFQPTPSEEKVVEAPAAPKKPVFSGINNISEVVTADGQKIVIVIANDMPADKEAAVSSIKAQVAATIPNRASVSEPEDDSSDSDWSPHSPVSRKASAVSVVAPRARKAGGVSVGRVAKQRGPYSKRAHASVKDKKERKKLQNVEAARRYRDKKKAEQSVIEGEEDELAEKNRALKGKVSEMENELKTLKKLMMELGLVK